MGSWTNATPAVPSGYTARPAARRLPPDARRPATATTAGILRPREHSTVVELDRPAASPELETWVEHYWTARWDLGDAAYRSEVVPHPAVHLSVESGTTPHHGIPMPAALVHGVVTTRFTVDLAGEGRVFGVKFRPGGFGAFTGEDVGAWTGRVLDLRAAFGDAADALREAVLETDTDQERVLVMDAFLMTRRPGPDAAYERVLDVVAGMLADPTLISVEAVCHRYGVSVRTLQRLFRRYVGVGPEVGAAPVPAARRGCPDRRRRGPRPRRPGDAARLVRPGPLHPRLHRGGRQISFHVRRIWLGWRYARVGAHHG